MVSSMTKMGGVGALLMNLYRNIDRERVCFDFLSLSLSDFEECNADITSIGGVLYCIPNLSSCGLFAFIRYIRSMILSNGPYDSIHLHVYHLSGIVGWVARRIGIQSIITHSHVTQYEGRNRHSFVFGPFFLLSQWLIRSRSTLFMACSRDAGEALFGPNIVSSEKFRVLKNAIDTSEFRRMSQNEIASMKSKNEINRDDLVIGNIGRLSYSKNQIFLIHIFCEVLRVHKSAVLVIIGKGELEDELRKEVRSKEIEDRVIFTGAQDNIPEWLSILDIFVMPSLFEGIGIVNIEAQALSVPCVVSDVIPIEADLGLGLMQRVSLTKSPSEWAKTVLAAVSLVRPHRDVIQATLQAKGYDIKAVARQMEHLYLDQAERGNI